MGDIINSLIVTYFFILWIFIYELFPIFDYTSVVTSTGSSDKAAMLCKDSKQCNN